MNPLRDLINELKENIEEQEEEIKILKDEIMKKKYYIQGLEYSQNPKNVSSQKPPIKNNGK